MNNSSFFFFNNRGEFSSDCVLYFAVVYAEPDKHGYTVTPTCCQIQDDVLFWAYDGFLVCIFFVYLALKTKDLCYVYVEIHSSRCMLQISTQFLM